MRRRPFILALALAALLGSASAVVYADFPGLFPANTIFGNKGATRAAPAPLALPSCPDSGGNHLNYTTGGTGFTCGTTTGTGGITQLTGDATAGPGTGSQAATLAASGVSAGTYTKITVDTKGRATVGATAACADLSDDGAGCTAGAASTGTAGIVKLHNVPVSVGWPAALDPHNIVIATINQASTITAIIGVNEVLVGAAATVEVYKAGSTVSCGSGTILHSGSFNANASLDTNQSLTVTTSSLAAGDRICLQTTGGANWTSGAGIGTITVFLAPS